MNYDWREQIQTLGILKLAKILNKTKSPTELNINQKIISVMKKIL